MRPMQILLSIILLSFSASVSADDRACAALIEEFGIAPLSKGETVMRKFQLEGLTKDDRKCSVKFLPDYCSFEIGSPLETPEMYYLKDTSYSTVRFTWNNSNRFSFKAVTKESTDDWGQVTKVLRIDEEGKGGYELKYDRKEGRFFKNDAKSFKCLVNVPRP